MTPRERIIATLENRQQDRVAIDFGAHRSSRMKEPELGSNKPLQSLHFYVG